VRGDKIWFVDYELYNPVELFSSELIDKKMNIKFRYSSLSSSGQEKYCKKKKEAVLPLYFMCTLDPFVLNVISHGAVPFFFIVFLFL